MSLPAEELAPGSSFGAYRINKLLGRGGMGAVYEAVHRDDGRVVALKLLSVELDNMDSRQRFLREGQSAAAINHPNAVYIYGTEEIGGVPVISMELVPGGTLEEKVKERGPLMRDFGLDIVTANGEPAGRGRILLRNIVTWSPVLFPFVLYAAIVAATPATAALAMEGAGILVLFVVAIALWFGIRTPERGVADRLAGTWLVPE